MYTPSRIVILEIAANAVSIPSRSFGLEQLKHGF